MKDNSEIRLRLTKIVHELINCEMTIEECVKKWWLTPYSSGGFRLSSLGAQAFEDAKIEFSIHSFKEHVRLMPFYFEHTVRLAQMPCPFYVIFDRMFVSGIKVYDDRISTLVYLYGDIDKYLSSLEKE